MLVELGRPLLIWFYLKVEGRLLLTSLNLGAGIEKAGADLGRLVSPVYLAGLETLVIDA